MPIRQYTPTDFDTLQKIHARQGFGYPFPDLSDPIFLSKLVLEAESPKSAGDPAPAANGSHIVMASLARLTCEIYLLADPAAGTPRERYTRMLELHRAAESDLRARGLADAHAWLPPQIARRFGRRLETLGWLRDDAWTPYCRRF